MEKDLYVWHYLHNSAQGRTLAERVNEREAVVPLHSRRAEDGIVFLEEYKFNVDVRDKRTLIAFDGHLIWGGLPKSSTVVKIVDLGNISLDFDARQLSLQDELQEYWISRASGKKKVNICIYRYFVLLRTSRSVVRRFETKSLLPQYVFIIVDKNGVVEWHTSTR